MKYLTIIVLLLFGCQNNNTKDIYTEVEIIDPQANTANSLVTVSDQSFLDSLYTCKCDKFISKLEEIPGKETNAYRITISSINKIWKKSKLINTRPEMSRISYCNEFYTVVSFACGGPCHSELFVFTEEHRPDEQYVYTQIIKNNPTVISHIKNEEFEKLILHNLRNNKEMTVDISEIGLYNYGQMDSMIMKKENVILHYSTETEKLETKTISLKPIL